VIAGCAAPPPNAAARPASASTDSAQAPAGARFYGQRPYGSEAEFNPFSTVVNEGFDQLSRADANRHVFSFNYHAAATNVLHSALNPVRAWRGYGWSHWLHDEVLPISGKASGGGQWVPAYELHVLGEGMTSVALQEWYADHGVPHPEFFGDLTNYTYGFINEMIEHPTGNGTNENAATRLDIDDPLGLILWHFDGMRNLFGGSVRLTNWFPQATLTFPDRNLRDATLQNATEVYMIRTKLPGTDTWRLMAIFGGAQVIGLSRRMYADRWLTVAAGEDPAENPVIDTVTGQETVLLQPNYGAYFDRDGSLLASLVVRTERSERVILNVYPGVLQLGSLSPGLMAEFMKTGQLRVGIVSGFGLGIGTGPRVQPPP